MSATRSCLLVSWGVCSALVAGEAVGAAAPPAEPVGHLARVSASLFGGEGDERIAGLAIQSDRSVVAVGSCSAPSPSPDGRFLIGVIHDGGNAISARDPSDPRKKIDAEVFAGVYQGGPGHGMRGAITTSSAIHLARAGYQAQALDQPPGEATR